MATKNLIRPWIPAFEPYHCDLVGLTGSILSKKRFEEAYRPSPAPGELEIAIG